MVFIDGGAKRGKHKVWSTRRAMVVDTFFRELHVVSPICDCSDVPMLTREIPTWMFLPGCCYSISTDVTFVDTVADYAT